MFWKDYSILWSKTNYLYSGQSGGIEKIGESIMLTYFNFILGNGTLITQSFDIRPINYPLASGSFIIPSDPITGSIPPTSLDIPANAYKIQCNLEATNDWYINLTTGSNGTASYSIVSGSLYSGSYCSVIFDILNTWKGTSIDLQPAYKNVGWNNYFVLGDTFPITCSNNTATCNLIQGLTYKGWIRGTIKDTPFSILPSGSSGYASNMLVTSQYVSKIITPQNQGQYGYTAQSSDARFAPIGDSARSASWASSSLGDVPVGCVVAWLQNLSGTPALPSNFVQCNGQTITDPQSPYSGSTISNLNGSGAQTQRFLRGSTTSGGTGGSDTNTHYHNITFNQNAAGSSPCSANGSTDNTTISILPSYYEVVWVLRIK